MRSLYFLPLLLLAACDVNRDSANEQVTLQYDSEKIENGAAAAARTAQEVGSGLGNVAASTGRAISNEVGDIDVDLDVRRNRDGGNQAEGNTQ